MTKPLDCDTVGESPADASELRKMKEKHGKHLSRRDVGLINNKDDLLQLLFLLDSENDDDFDRVNHYARLRTAERDESRTNSVLNEPQSSQSARNEDEETFRIFSQNRSSIYKLISDEIGMKYRHLARELGLREGVLDQIDLEQRTVQDRVYKILAVFEENEEKCNIAEKLCEALECCRRSDIMRKVRKKLL